MKTRLLSVFLSILLISSLFSPVVNAAPPDGIEEPKLGIAPAAVFVIPEAVELTICGISCVIAAVPLVKAGDSLNIRFDDCVEAMREAAGDTTTRITDAAGNTIAIVHATAADVSRAWEQFILDVSNKVDDLMRAKNWVEVTSNEGNAVMTLLYECLTADGSSSGKKDDKWYFEARLHKRKIEINTEQMDIDQAVKEMHRGKHIMTLNRELAQKLVGRFEGLTGDAIKQQKFDGNHNPAADKFLHLHYTAHEMRLHCWIWKDI